MPTIIERAAKKVSKAACEYEPAQDVYYIVMGTDADRMNEHPAMNNYCENCIDEAVQEAKRKYFLDRMSEMGKIYEYQQSGFYREPIYKWGKNGKATGVVISKVKANAPKEKMIRYLKRRLGEKYPAKMLFDYRYTCCGETDDFDTCESCGIIFAQGLLLSDQEMDHWESLSNRELKKCIRNPFHAFQLGKILSDYRQDHKLAQRILNLAKRITQQP